jgi:hypothetical protein
MKVTTIIALLFALCCAGCSLTGGGGKNDDGPHVTGDFTKDEIRNYIILGANCQAISPYLRGRIVTVRWHEPQRYTWIDHEGNTQQTKLAGGVCHKQPGGSFIIAMMDHHLVKLHECGWHYNRINKFNDYSEPPVPHHWCDLVGNLVEAEVPPEIAGLEFVVIDELGRIR